MVGFNPTTYARVQRFFVLFVSFVVVTALSRLALPAFRLRGASGRKSFPRRDRSRGAPTSSACAQEAARKPSIAAVGMSDVNRARMKMKLVLDGAPYTRRRTTIFEISDYGRAKRGEVHADLVHASGEGRTATQA